MAIGMKNSVDRQLSLPQIYRFAPFAIRHRPDILVPFLVFAAIELIGLLFLYLAPRQPFNSVLGPPIRVFWGEAFLHYPNNFLLLPQLASFSRSVLYILAGSLLGGMAVLLVKQAYTGIRDTAPALAAFRRYLPLLGVSSMVTLLFAVLVKISSAYFTFYFLRHNSLFFIPQNVWNGPLLFIINLLIGVTVQSLFIYAVPVLMLEKTGLVKSVFRSFVLFKRMPVATVVLVTVPVLAYVPIMILQYKTPFFVELNPEAVLYIAAIGSLVNSLVVDVLVTVCVTYLYLKVREG